MPQRALSRGNMLYGREPFMGRAPNRCNFTPLHPSYHISNGTIWDRFHYTSYQAFRFIYFPTPNLRSFNENWIQICYRKRNRYFFIFFSFKWPQREINEQKLIETNKYRFKNFGCRINCGAHNFTLPSRQFVSDSFAYCVCNHHSVWKRQFSIGLAMYALRSKPKICQCFIHNAH